MQVEALSKEIKQVTSSWSLSLYSTIKMMHGPINTRLGKLEFIFVKSNESSHQAG